MLLSQQQEGHPTFENKCSSDNPQNSIFSSEPSQKISQ